MSTPGASGLTDVIGKAVGKAAGKAATELGGEAFSAEAASFWKRTFTTEDRFFFGKNSTPEAQFAGNLVKKVRERSAQIVPQLQQAPGMAPSGGARGMKQQLQGYSKDMAQDQILGKNKEILGTLYAISHAKNGPSHTINLMDHVALALREDKDIPGYMQERMTPEGKPFNVFVHSRERISPTKEAGFKAIAQLPQFKPGLGTTPQPWPKEYRTSEMSPYEQPSQLEKWVTNFTYARLSPLIAIPHLGTSLNIVLATKTGSWLPALIDSITNSTPQQIKDTLRAGGVMTESILRDLESRAQAENGIISKRLPGTYQDINAKVSSTPFFHQVRNFQANWAGAASYHDAIDYADMLHNDPFDKMAERRLEMYGMKPKDMAMIKQTGQLTQDQLERVVYNGANRMVFFDTSFARTFNAQRNGFWRATHLYHGYVSQQAKFMAEEWKTQVWNDTRTMGSIAKFGVVAGAAFPVFGEGIKILEMAARGQWRQIPNELRQDYEGITLQKGDTELERWKNFFETYIDGYMHLGGLGIGYGLIQGAHRGVLAAQQEGAILGTGWKYVQDTYNMTFEGKSAAPFLRDTLSYGIPWGIGRFAAHTFFPTKAEEKAANPYASLHKLGRKKRGSGLKPLPRLN